MYPACAHEEVSSLHEAVGLLLEQEVSVFPMSVGYTYEGPGDGSTPIVESMSALGAIEKAVKNGAVWVNPAGNYGDKGWTLPRHSADDIQAVEEGDGLCPIVRVDFDTTAGNDTNSWMQQADQASPAYTDIDLRWAGGGELLPKRDLGSVTASQLILCGSMTGAAPRLYKIRI